MAGRDPFAVRIRQLLRASDRGDRVAEAMRELCPELTRDLVADGARQPLLSLWGTSINRDELAGHDIVPQPILNAIAELSRQPIIDGRFHAGLLHTYGYLFSALQTEYGFKRERWTEPDIEDGLGISQPALRPQPTSGTLFTNATYFLGRIAFRGMRNELAVLRRQRSAVSPALQRYPYRSLMIDRITDTVRLNRSTTVELRTDLIRLPNPQPQCAHILVYSAADPRQRRGVLFTMFPMQPCGANQLLRIAEQDSAPMVRSRYNAFIDGLTGRPRKGRRCVTRSAADRNSASTNR